MQTAYFLRRRSRIYPNPSKGLLNIDLQKTYNNVGIDVINILGQRTQTFAFDTFSKKKITIKGATGIYFIRINSEDGLSLTKKIILN
ncbi:T9SS type A sorting domain-containing protein [Aestuariivivens insulae]|uniref:T9SS type A sorting domain-containing protein n=1 Tax=Aestuariivivens insulae TaxID=1621988 RepID=UPI00374CF17B